MWVENRAAPSERQLRIAHVLAGMDRGGVETWLMHVLRTIDRSRFHMDFIVHTDKNCAYDDEIRSLGCRILPCLAPDRPWSYALKLNNILRKAGAYDVVHSHVHHFTGFVLAIASHAGVPVRIAHSHNDTRLAESNANVLRAGYLRVMKFLINRYATAGLAASGPAAISLYGQGQKADPRWAILYYGIDLTTFGAPVDRACARSGLGLPPDAFVVGHVGRFVRQKNHHFLLHIALEVTKRDPKAYFLLIGEGQLRREIEAKAATLGLARRIIFTGARPDATSVMRTVMDAFLFPSLFEGLGIVLLEAQAAGLPIVTSTAVPDEADVIKSLIRRLPLSSSPQTWAQAVIDSRQISSRIGRQEALLTMSRSAFNIKVSAERLCQTYVAGYERHLGTTVTRPYAQDSAANVNDTAGNPRSLLN